MSLSLRRCGKCHMSKPESEFAFRNRAKGTCRSSCRDCARLASRAHYEANRERYVDRAHAWRPRERSMVRERLFAYLREHPCVDCGQPDPVVLELDHRDPGTKSASIARLAGSTSWGPVRREIEKCDVRCANCHRMRTALQFGWSIRVSERVAGRIAAQTGP